jgi:hypothetical protein
LSRSARHSMRHLLESETDAILEGYEGAALPVLAPEQ